MKTPFIRVNANEKRFALHNFGSFHQAAPAAAKADDDDDDDDLFGDDDEEEEAKPAASRADKMAEAKKAKDANKKVDR